MMKPDQMVETIKEILVDYEESTATAIQKELAYRATGDVKGKVPSDLTRFLTWMERQGMIMSKEGKYSLVKQSV